MKSLVSCAVLLTAACTTSSPQLGDSERALIASARTVYVASDDLRGLRDEAERALRSELAGCHSSLEFTSDPTVADLTVAYVHRGAICVDCEREPAPEGWGFTIGTPETTLVRVTKRNVGCVSWSCVIKRSMRAAATILCETTDPAVRCAQSVPAPSSASRMITVEEAEAITPSLPMSEILARLGVPKRDGCSGLYCPEWDVADGRVLIIRSASGCDQPLEIRLVEPTKPASTDTGSFETAVNGETAAATIHEVGGDVLPPRRIGACDPVIPEELKGIQIQQPLFVYEIVISETGEVVSVALKQASHSGAPYDLLEKAVREAIQECRFLPGTKNGVPVVVRMLMMMRTEVR